MATIKDVARMAEVSVLRLSPDAIVVEENSADGGYRAAQDLIGAAMKVDTTWIGRGENG